MPLLALTDRGLYCEAGDFHIDPWEPVDRAVVTHAHGDHASWGSRGYLTSEPGLAVLRARLQPGATIRGVPYGQALSLNGVTVSLHPAGHILGSAQVRIAHRGEVWVVSGDYKTDPDPTCTPFEPVRCHTFVTESTFGLPIYRWAPQAEVFDEINRWWRGNAAAGKTSLLFGYTLGKAQRLIAGLDPGIGPILTHGAVERMTRTYRETGVSLPPTTYAGTVTQERRADAKGAIVIAPPHASGSPWLRRFAPYSTGFASGWMLVRGARRRRSLDRGFALSDHVDWPNLLAAVEASGAGEVWVTHGFTGPVVRWLTEHGIEARAVQTRFEGERDDEVSEEAGQQGGGAALSEEFQEL
ncbi:MAG TPA: ligase-associated DNA damage response exonuclease [Gemmatimonadales bacterium]|nr:ligase-associated DNA damage response exonuclease [Gemmatimonadales bacterium]